MFGQKPRVTGKILGDTTPDKESGAQKFEERQKCQLSYTTQLKNHFIHTCSGSLYFKINILITCIYVCK